MLAGAVELWRRVPEVPPKLVEIIMSIAVLVASLSRLWHWTWSFRQLIQPPAARCASNLEPICQETPKHKARRRDELRAKQHERREHQGRERERERAAAPARAQQQQQQEQAKQPATAATNCVLTPNSSGGTAHLACHRTAASPLPGRDMQKCRRLFLWAALDILRQRLAAT